MVGEKKTLDNKPLLEAIFELRWELGSQNAAVSVDPHYEIFFGRFYDRIRQEYPVHTRLPTADLPAEISQFVPRHQFRKVKDNWPLVQVGHGVVTLNETFAYDWEDFFGRIKYLLAVLFETYPSGNLKPAGIQLRYIDAIDFDFQKENAFEFLRTKMKTRIELNGELFQDTGVSSSPLGFDLRFHFMSSQPKGHMVQRLVRGEVKGRTSLVWETIVQALPEEIAQDPETISDWVSQAHDLTHDWFFKTIEGELERRFS